jgi:tRNA 2-selenouridine synthase
MYRGHEVVDRWFDLIDRDDRIALCRALAEEHYDPAYSKAARISGEAIAARFDTGSLDPDALAALAGRIARHVQSISI